MITLLILLLACAIVGSIFMILYGLVKIAPILIGIALLPILDFLVIKALFFRKRKEDKES